MGEYSLGEALQIFLERSKLKHGVQSARIEEVWAEIMGKTIARYTDKIQIINQTLFVTTAVAPLKQELHYQKATIIKRVNEVLGSNTIRELVIR